MAYFDNPENMEKWQQELKTLRVERQRRQNKADTPEMETEDSMELDAQWEAEAEIDAELETVRQPAAFQERSHPDFAPIREEISFEQLEVEAGVRRAPAVSATKDLSRQKELSMDREMS